MTAENSVGVGLSPLRFQKDDGTKCKAGMFPLRRAVLFDYHTMGNENTLAVLL